MATDFQKKVWAEIDKIPYGSTMTYKQIAKKLASQMQLELLQMHVVKTQHLLLDHVTELYVQMEIWGVIAPQGAQS